MSSQDAPKKKASRFTGVFRAGKKWKSQVQHNSVQNYLGIYDSEEEASRAYQEYKAKQAASIAFSSSNADQEHSKAPPVVTRKSASTDVPSMFPAALNVATDRNAGKTPDMAAPVAAAPPSPLPVPPLPRRLSQLSSKQHPDTPLDRLQWDETSAPVSVELPAERIDELRLKLRLGELLYCNHSLLHSARLASGDGGDTAEAMLLRFLVVEIRKHT